MRTLLSHRALLVAAVIFGLVIICGQKSWMAPQGAKPAHTLMPVPAAVLFRSGRLALRSNFTVVVQGMGDDRLRRGIERAVARLEKRTGLKMPRARSEDGAAAATLVVACDGPGKAAPALGEDESYALVVSARQATLRASTTVGALWGLETLLQLVEGRRGACSLPAVQIVDQPRFPWRGLLIDVSRHWQPVEVIERNLDGMAAVKLNVLHWHLTDDQGFRIESRRYPKLHQMGSDGKFYTQEQVRAVIAYARDRGIRVVPEFDVPAHTQSWLVGYPELASAPGPYTIARSMGIKDAVMDPTRPELYAMLDGFFGEMAALFPDDYLHIGGDENNGRHWSRNPQIQAYMRDHGIASNEALQTVFNQRVAEILKKHGKKMVGWDEILQPGLPADAVVQSWRGPRSLRESARRGYPVILSSGYYLDHILPAAEHYRVDPLPDGNDLSKEEAARVLGGEACMWGEYVTPETIDSRTWPRTAAIAERLWSPASVRDEGDMYRRLEAVSARLTERGLMHESYVDPMLRRMAGTGTIGALRTLVDVVEPVNYYSRGRVHPITTETPLSFLVDAARPDSAAARRFAALVDGFLADAPRFRTDRAALQRVLTTWRDLRPGAQTLVPRALEQGEALPLAIKLQAMGIAGMEAVRFLTTGAAPPAGWRDARLALLDEARRPQAEVEFAILPAMRKLVMAVGARR